MKTTVAIKIGVFVTLAGAGTLSAHHSGSMYQATAVWIEGRVVSFEPINPHSIMTLEGTDASGQTHRWAVEGPPQSALARRTDAAALPAEGDVVRFCAFPYKSRDELSALFPDADFSTSRVLASGDGATPQYVAGHVMILAGGEMRFWEPHGVLSDCMRSDDLPRQAWIDFLDADAQARQGWCEQQTYAVVRSNAERQAMVDEVDGLLRYPCG